MKLKIAIFVFITVFSASVLYAQDEIILNREGVKKGREGDFQGAVNDFNEAINTGNEGLSKVYHNKGWIFEQQGEYVNALKNYESALALTPNQIITLEKAGYLYFKTKNFTKAVEYGEKVLTLDPENTEVIKWLKDAHAKRLTQKEVDIVKKEEEKAKENLAKEISEEQKEKQKLFSISYSGIIRTAYKLHEDKGFAYEDTEGLFYMNFPQMLNVNVTPTEKMEFNFITGTPYLGALMPDVANWMERFEAVYRDGTVNLGIGVLGVHYMNDNVFGERKRLHDMKFGVILGKADVNYKFQMAFYPKLIPHDSGYKPEKTMDTDLIDIFLGLNLFETIGVYTRLNIFEFYFYDHTPPAVSNYVGKYDFTIGFSFFDNSKSKFILRAELTERLYTLDVMNDKPYDFLNGQGFFGLNRFKWFKGDPMSGVDTVSTILTVRAEEKASTNLRFNQAVIIEIVPSSRAQHEFCLEAGAGFYY